MATLAGIAAHEVWRVFPAERLLLSLVLAGIVALVAWPLRRWWRWQAATAFAAVWFALLTLFVGPAPVASTLLLGAAAWAIGDWRLAIGSCPRTRLHGPRLPSWSA